MLIIYKSFPHTLRSVDSAVNVNSASLLTSILKCCHGEKSSPKTGSEMRLKRLKMVSGLVTSCLLGAETHPTQGLKSFDVTPSTVFCF